MRAVILLGCLVVAPASACFSEPFVYHCDAGEKGCRCNGTLCLSGLVCSEEHCVLPDCERGTAFCNCDDGKCDADLVCWEGGACVPADGSEGTAGGSMGTTSTSIGTVSTDVVTESTTDPTTSASTEVPTTSSADTSDSEGCTPGTPCGECRVCDDGGACEADVDAVCDGPALECDEFAWGYQDGTCHRMVAASLPARCNANATCIPAVAQDCAARQGEAHVECDPGCVDAAAICATYAPIATVSLEGMCVTSGQGPDCTDSCHNGTGSNVNHRTCTGDGQCMLVPEQCDPYACENAMCNTDCVDSLDCAGDYICVMDDCMAA